MGCASSKRTQTRCKHCQTPYHSSPLPRSYSVPVHHPASKKGDSYHVVALTSSTLGSLPRDSIDFDEQQKITAKYNYKDVDDEKGKEFLTEVLQAKNWSTMIEEKIPKVIPRTPTRTPPGEPETINTWEMMEGLDDHSPLQLPNLPKRLHERSFSFHGPMFSEDSMDSPTIVPKLKPQENSTVESLKPQWMTEEDSVSNLNTIISEFDPEIVSQFRKALEELSPIPTAHLKSPEREKTPTPYSKENSFLSKDFIDTKEEEDMIAPSKSPPEGEDKVVIYFTSLRGVRKTYEDCCDVRVMLKGFGVRVDERDVSMHYVFREELKELSEEVGCGSGLPRVFVKGKCIGGAEEIRQMNEDGMLEKLVEGCALVEEGNGMGACGLCGDVRFVPCESCSGSCKIYCEEEGDEWEGEEGVGEFQRCPDCNENGIVRCPVCCY